MSRSPPGRGDHDLRRTIADDAHAVADAVVVRETVNVDQRDAVAIGGADVERGGKRRRLPRLHRHRPAFGKAQ